MKSKAKGSIIAGAIILSIPVLAALCVYLLIDSVLSLAPELEVLRINVALAYWSVFLCVALKVMLDSNQK
jgi:hypothetical protein